MSPYERIRTAELQVTNEIQARGNCQITASIVRFSTSRVAIVALKRPVESPVDRGVALFSSGEGFRLSRKQSGCARSVGDVEDISSGPRPRRTRFPPLPLSRRRLSGPDYYQSNDASLDLFRSTKSHELLATEDAMLVPESVRKGLDRTMRIRQRQIPDLLRERIDWQKRTRSTLQTQVRFR